MCRSVPILAGLLLASVCGATAMARGEEAFFLPLGDLPGGQFYSLAAAVSADGEVVVGTSVSARGSEAFRWTRATGMQTLGITFNCEALAVSADGSVIAGVATVTPGRVDGDVIFRWTKEGVENLGNPVGARPFVHGMSADGNVIAGTVQIQKTAADGRSYDGTTAFRWQRGSGTFLPDLPAERAWSSALAVSGDGSLIVGGISSPTEWKGGHPVVWKGKQASVLFDRDWGDGWATAISPDGRVVAGYQGDGRGGFCWTRDSPERPVGIPDFSLPRGITADGRLIVGEGRLPDGRQAVLWDPDRGLRALQQVLSEAGLMPDGWKLTAARDVTPDGRFLVGSGTNPDGKPEGWLVRLPADQLP